MLWFFLFVSLIGYILWFYYKNIYLFQKQTNIPGVSFFKSFSVIRQDNPKLSTDYAREHGYYKDFFSGWFGLKFVVHAVDPESIKWVLKEPSFIKIPVLLTSPKQLYYFGPSILAKNGDDWRRVHNVVSSGFNSAALSSYYPTFLELTEKALKKIPLDRDLEVTDFLSRFTIDVLGRAIFNHDYRRLDGGEIDKYYKAYQTTFITNPWKKLIFSLPFVEKLPFEFIQYHHQQLEILVGFFKKMIEDHRGNENNSVLSKLLQANGGTEGLSDQELLANIWVFFLAGHETTARALTYAMNCLRTYPDIQEKIYEEIKTNIGTEKVPTEADLDGLVYLDCFLNELFRTHTPTPVLRGRVATKEVKYKDMIIPKGTVIGLHLQILHTNPEHWNDPLKFDPERFTAENRKGRNHFLHVPFGAGLRQCLGLNFSLREQRLFLTSLLQKYRVVPPKDNNAFPDDKVLVVGGRYNFYVRVEKR